MLQFSFKDFFVVAEKGQRTEAVKNAAARVQKGSTNGHTKSWSLLQALLLLGSATGMCDSATVCADDQFLIPNGRRERVRCTLVSAVQHYESNALQCACADASASMMKWCRNILIVRQSSVAVTMAIRKESKNACPVEGKMLELQWC